MRFEPDDEGMRAAANEATRAFVEKLQPALDALYSEHAGSDFAQVRAAVASHPAIVEAGTDGEYIDEWARLIAESQRPMLQAPGDG